LKGLEDKKVVELASDDTHFGITALNFVNRDTIVNFAVVRLAAAEVAREDINVTLTLASSATLINDYNAAHGTTLVSFPSNLYVLQGGALVVTIPKGEREGYVKLKVNPSTFDPSSTYALGFSIASVDKQGYTISQNFKTFIRAIGAKNEYDGKYELHTGFYHPTSNPNRDVLTIDVEMHTTGPNSVKMFSPDFPGYYHPALFAGAISAFGSQEPNYTINPTTNKVTVQNVAAGAVTFYMMAPNYDSRYNPATRTIYAKFGYNYSPGPVFNPATNREWTDTLVYKGPR
ncbi:MAG TPA: DUF1735 domain-containing protein, partial [Flavisolibacter sp.]|nr:DUF1735 domain-containing protein [Flavisolibacter sp.]